MLSHCASSATPPSISTMACNRANALEWATILMATASPAAPLATIADLRRTRVEAEIDEFDVGSIALGSRAIVAAEGFPHMTWNGRVEEIPDAVAGRRLKPQDPGRPADVRVLLVKIALDAPAPLKLGQRVEVSIGRRDARELGTATPRSVPHPRR